jgi:Nif-specific regulatory protein
MRRDGSSQGRLNLALLCRLASRLHALGDVPQLVQLVVQTLHEATGAAPIYVWLVGPDGRLRRHTERGEQPEAQTDHLLASLAMENGEAMLTDLSRSDVTKESDLIRPLLGKPDTRPMSLAEMEGRPLTTASTPAMAAPIPGRDAPRGAIECRRGDSSERFQRSDLEFLIAVAHQFGMALENLEHRHRLEQANEQLRQRLATCSRIVGDSPVMRDLLEQVARAAPVPSTVLVLGESGVGKELVAHTLHELSGRSAGPFVAVNCAAFPESRLESELFGYEAGAFTGAERRRLGQFERAHRGTIFLDEIGEMSPACQAKLLRIVEGHPFERLGGEQAIRVDVRLIAATHRDLGELVKAGRFREDLYYRLRVIELRVPPLRDRDEDVVQLAVAFLKRYRLELGRGPARFSNAAIEAIRRYDWPGNVRELKNAIERAMVMGAAEEIRPEDLGLNLLHPSPRESQTLCTLEEAERRHIEYVLRRVRGNKTLACKILNIGRGTLYKKLESDTAASTNDETPDSGQSLRD